MKKTIRLEKTDRNHKAEVSPRGLTSTLEENRPRPGKFFRMQRTKRGPLRLPEVGDMLSGIRRTWDSSAIPRVTTPHSGASRLRRHSAPDREFHARPQTRQIVRAEEKLSLDVRALRKLTAHVPFLRKLLEDQLQREGEESGARAPTKKKPWSPWGGGQGPSRHGTRQAARAATGWK